MVPKSTPIGSKRNIVCGFTKERESLQKVFGLAKQRHMRAKSGLLQEPSGLLEEAW